MLPRHIPIKTTAEVHFFFVSPAVFVACQLKIKGVMAARMETCIRVDKLMSMNCRARRKKRALGHVTLTWMMRDTDKIISEKKNSLLLPGNSEHDHGSNGGKDCGSGNDKALALEP